MPAYPGSAGRAGGGAAVILLYILSYFQEKENVKKSFFAETQTEKRLLAPDEDKTRDAFLHPAFA